MMQQEMMQEPFDFHGSQEPGLSREERLERLTREIEFATRQVQIWTESLHQKQGVNAHFQGEMAREAQAEQHRLIAEQEALLQTERERAEQAANERAIELEAQRIAAEGPAPQDPVAVAEPSGAVSPATEPDTSVPAPVL